MKSVDELRKREAARAGKKARVYSTSEGRANFAEALGSAQLDHAVIGFDRYGRPLAALVSIDAVRILAGQADEVEPEVRDKVQRMAKLFLDTVPNSGLSSKPTPKPRNVAPRPPRPAKAARKKKAAKKTRARR